MFKMLINYLPYLLNLSKFKFNIRKRININKSDPSDTFSTVPKALWYQLPVGQWEDILFQVVEYFSWFLLVRQKGF